MEVRLAGDPLKPGDVRGPADALEIDNHRYLAVNVRQAMRVLCIDGRPAGDPRKASVFNLALALPSRSDPNSHSPIELDVAPQSAVLERDLAALRLRDALQRGPIHGQRSQRAGQLPGPRRQSGVFPRRSRHGRQLQQRAGGPGAEGSRQILPARLFAVAKNPPADASIRWTIGIRSCRNSAATKRRSLLESPVDRYFKVKLLEAAPGEQAPAPARRGRQGQERCTACRARRVVLKLSNGDPLIVAQPIRRGRVVLVTTSADASWSLLPVWGTYEPLVKEILAWCIAGQAQPRNSEVGDPLESTLAGDAGPDERLGRASRRSAPLGAVGGRKAITARGATTIR